jgi:hypothetical protein
MPVVVHNGIGAGVESANLAEVRTTAAEIREPRDHPFPYASLTVEATCPCGKRFTVDLVKVLEGEPQQPRERRWPQIHGVSWKRRPHSAGLE